MNAMQFAERHQEQMMISEPDDFSERGAVMPRGFDAANFTDGGDGAFGFDDEADDLHDAAATFGDARGTHALQRGIEAVGLAGRGLHATSDCRSCSSLVSR